MKKTWLALGAFGALTMLSGAKAQAEPTLREILDTKYSKGNWQLVSDNLFTHSSDSAVEVTSVNAGYAPKTGVGYYTGATDTELFYGTNNTGTYNVPAPPLTFGLYIDVLETAKNKNDGTNYYQDAAKNTGYDGNNFKTPLNSTHDASVGLDKKTNTVRALVYQITDKSNEYVVAFEDLGGGSTDFNDVVLQIDNVNVVPEPAFYQMGAFLTGGGLLALRLRKRKNA